MDKKLIQQYKEVFRTGAGAAVLQDLMSSYMADQCAKFESTNETFFNLGRKSVVDDILQMINVNEEELEKLLTNNNFQF